MHPSGEIFVGNGVKGNEGDRVGCEVTVFLVGEAVAGDAVGDDVRGATVGAFTGDADGDGVRGATVGALVTGFLLGKSEGEPVASVGEALPSHNPHVKGQYSGTGCILHLFHVCFLLAQSH